MTPGLPRLLGLAGLLPALACLLAALLGGPDWHFAALAIGFGYSALIFSFLGGLWWGLAASPAAEAKQAPGWVYVISVVPSLLALLAYLPWVAGLTWPGPSMIGLGLLIGASPFVDRALSRLGLVPDWWMGLRWTLSLGLGGATFLMGLAP